jgi:hypothetical protein
VDYAPKTIYLALPLNFYPIVITPVCRRKVQDFYQRTSLTAYCTAFAYRPLSCFPSAELSNMYLELPADSKALYVQHSQRGSVSMDNISTQPARSQSEDSMNTRTAVSFIISLNYVVFDVNMLCSFNG